MFLFLVDARGAPAPITGGELFVLLGYSQRIQGCKKSVVETSFVVVGTQGFGYSRKEYHPQLNCYQIPTTSGILCKPYPTSHPRIPRLYPVPQLRERFTVTGRKIS